jgi:hypothetical protein
MNKKFVKENKSLVKEFISALISSIVTGKLSKNLEKTLMSKPETKKDIQDLRKLRNSMKTRLDRMKKEDPKRYAILTRNFK